MATVSYPYDPNGTASTNLVTGETQVLTQINSDPYRYVIPMFAPFYQNNFQAIGKTTTGTDVILRYGTDFVFSMKYIGASRANGAMIFGAISIVNQNIQGPITLQYQCLGGAYSADRNYVIEKIAENNYNPRRCAWDQVTNAPTTFPPSGHPEDLDDMTGYRDLIDAVDRIAVANSNTDTIRNELRQHILNTNDPHETLTHLPDDLIRRPEFLAHVQDYNDPHKTIVKVAVDFATKDEVAEAIDDHVAQPDPHNHYFNITRLEQFIQAEYKDDLPVKFFRVNF